MKTQDAITHFGSQAEVARVLRISRQAVNQWPEDVPAEYVRALHWHSAGRVAMRRDDYFPWPRWMWEQVKT